MYVTLASILKYPCSSIEVDNTKLHRKKYGYFQSDKEAFLAILNEFGLNVISSGPVRHPFVYLVEAADDICYRIVDMEDAHRIGILSKHEIEHAFLSLITEMSDQKNTIDRTKDILSKISDDNEAISYLRAKCINGLVSKSAEAFFDHSSSILQGSFNYSLLDIVETVCPYLSIIKDISVSRIYNHHTVIEVELAGYNVMSEILSVFIFAVLNNNRTELEKKCLNLIPAQYNLAKDDVSAYEKTMGVLDFVSGMTDGYATELYRKMKGIDIPSHK